MNQRQTSVSCGLCGYPNRPDASKCLACGAKLKPHTELHDKADAQLPGEADASDFPALSGAFKAWRNQQYPQMISTCLEAMGMHKPVTVQSPTRLGWSFNQDSAAIYVVYEQERQRIAVESPVLRLPKTKRVAMMRTLLEMNARVLGISRFCVRDDIVVLRFAEDAAQLPPPSLANAIGEVATLADQLDDPIAMTFHAEMLGSKAQDANYDFAMLGEPRPVPMIAAHIAANAKHRKQEDALPAVFQRIRGLSTGAHTPDTMPKPQPIPGEATTPSQPSPEHPALQKLRGYIGVVADLERVLSVKHNAPAIAHALALRAVLYTLHARYRVSCPKATWHLMGKGRALLDELPLSDAAVSTTRSFYALLQDFLDSKGHVPGMPLPFELPKLLTRSAASSHVAELLILLDEVPRSLLAHVTILSGALYELRARGGIPGAERAAHDRFMQRMQGAPIDKHTRQELLARIERIGLGGIR
ncbi:MAG: YbjN domain-containing protein [Myxococcota bacterium]